MAPSPSPPASGAAESVAARPISETPPAERKYTSHACEACRSRRSKTDELQKKVKNLEHIITVLSLGSDDDALELLKTIRDNAPSPASGHSLNVADVLGEWHKSRETDVEYNAENTRLYTTNDLPPERLIQYGVTAYFNCSYTLFYIYEKHEMTDIIHRVYRPREPIDKATLCELCALTAIGSHYDAANFDVSVMENLYHTAAVYLSDCIEAHFLRGMRVILCLSMYSFMTKRISARYSLAMGLSIARQARLNGRMPTDLWVPYRKVYRSFVFMECWLSSSLGYQPGITDEEITFTSQPITEPQPTIENDIQAQLSAVGLMMAKILQDVYNSRPMGIFSLARRHSQTLQAWQDSLPPTMKLAELKKEEGNIFIEPHRRSLILVHVMYFGAQMLLQRRLLVTMAQERMNRRWTLDGSYEDGRIIEQQCIAAAEECVYLLDVLGYTRHMFRRCWLCIGHAFSACSVLLFDVALRLLYNQTAGVDEQLARSQECINMLEGCGEADRVAKAMLQIVLPLHRDLRRLASDQPVTRSGIHSLLENPLSGTTSTTTPEPQIRAAVIPAMQTAIEVLGNPFGHVRRNNIDSFAAGDPSVPSWWN